MVARAGHEWECEACQGGGEGKQKAYHEQMHLQMSRLDEQQRRGYAAVESNTLGNGGDVQVARITGLNVETSRRGRRELADQLAQQPVERVRVGGGGRPRVEKNSPKESNNCSR